MFCTLPPTSPKRKIIHHSFRDSWNRKLSLNYLQLYAMERNSYKEDSIKRRKSRRRGGDININNVDSITMEAPLSKNDMNAIRRSQVWTKFIDGLKEIVLCGHRKEKVIYSLYLSSLFFSSSIKEFVFIQFI